MSILLILPYAASAQVTSITYQGQLEQSGEPFTGAANLQFRLFDQLSGGSQIGSPQTLQSWPVEDGLFQVELDYDPADLAGGDRYLEIRVNGTPLSPRQKVTATPYALIAATTAAGAVDGSAIDPSEVQLRVGGDCPAGRSIRRILQDGSVVCETDDIGEPGWSLDGNSGTDPSTDFIGTTDAIPFEIRTANSRSLRIEPSAETFGGDPITANIIGGSSVNSVSPGVRGATIAGGGAPEDSESAFGGEAPNRVTAIYGTVSGGYNNIAGADDGQPTNGSFSTVGGGAGNTAGQFMSTVSGGQNNSSSGLASAVGGGNLNTASGNRSNVGGGQLNTASAGESTIAGGDRNTASGQYSAVGGGRENTASGFDSTVIGGFFNTSSGLFSTVSGGAGNCAGGEGSWAGGQNAKVRPGDNSGADGDGCSGVARSGDGNGDEGTFIWADSQQADLVSSGPDQFLVRASGGVGFGRAPVDHFEIETPFSFVPGDGVAPTGAFRVRLNGATKLRLLGNGGLAVGSSFNSSGVPQNGLSVLGNIHLNSFAPAGGDPLCRNADDLIALCSSSARYKDEIEALDLGLDTVLKLAPVAYRWTSNDREDLGFVAEDLAAIDERLITRNAAGEVEGVRYGRLTAILANAVQSMNQEQQDQRIEMAELQAENVELRELLALLRSEQNDRNARMARELAMLRDLVALRMARDTP